MLMYRVLLVYPLDIQSGNQHSALVVVACFYSFEHISPNLHFGSLYLVHARYLAYLHIPAQAGCGLAWPIDHLYV